VHAFEVGKMPLDSAEKNPCPDIANKENHDVVGFQPGEWNRQRNVDEALLHPGKSKTGRPERGSRQTKHVEENSTVGIIRLLITGMIACDIARVQGVLGQKAHSGHAMVEIIQVLPVKAEHERYGELPNDYSDEGKDKGPNKVVQTLMAGEQIKEIKDVIEISREFH
jgi:hypothetical protein